MQHDIEYVHMNPSEVEELSHYLGAPEMLPGASKSVLFKDASFFDRPDVIESLYERGNAIKKSHFYSQLSSALDQDAAKGRYGDTLSVGLPKRAVDRIAYSFGGRVTKNEETGRREFFLGALLGGLGKAILPGIGGALGNLVGGGIDSIGNAIGGLFGGHRRPAAAPAPAPAAAAPAAPARPSYAPAPGMGGGSPSPSWGNPMGMASQFMSPSQNRPWQQAMPAAFGTGASTAGMNYMDGMPMHQALASGAQSAAQNWGGGFGRTAAHGFGQMANGATPYQAAWSTADNMASRFPQNPFSRMYGSVRDMYGPQGGGMSSAGGRHGMGSMPSYQ